MVPANQHGSQKLLNCRIMTTFTPIDLDWTGRPKSIAALLIESAGESAVVDPGPESTLETLRENLAARGLSFQSLDSLLLTHIHLDHAGATGAILRENPGLKVYVHEFGAMHMVDPSRLLASAGRLYGGDIGRLYGECLPVAETSLESLEGGESIRIGEAELAVFYTPGHASHHVTYWDQVSRTAMVGDTAGIRVEGDSFLLPATPPPDIDIEIWNRSLDAISSWAPERLFLTHFGFIESPREHIKLYKSRLEEWSALTAKLIESGVELTEAEKMFVDSVTSEIKTTLPSDAAEHYIFNGGLRLSWLGLMRYATRKASKSRATT
jgi:glyoxylase-like metal-dependent hydrolase (beta-lactamase superfamily II)